MNREEHEKHERLCDIDIPDIQNRLALLETDISFLLSLFMCESCEGNGEVLKDDDTWEKCADCGGKGWTK